MLSLLLLFAVSAFAQQCTYDYNCGNIPYRYCSGGADDCTTTLNGVAVGGNYVYYAQICRTTGLQPNITIKRVSAAGGVPQDINTRQQIPAAVNPQKILGFADNHVFYDIVFRQPGRGLRALNINTNTEKSITTDSFLQSQLDFDIPAATTYACNYRPGGNGPANYTIDRYTGIPTSGALAGGRTVYVLSSSQTCGPLRRFGNDAIFFADVHYTINGTTSSIYRGTTSCVNCELPRPIFTTAEQIVDMDLSSNNFIVYGTVTGLYRLSLDGSVRVQLASGAINGVIVDGQTVYYNTGSSIRSINVNGNNDKSLIQPRQGSCVCRPVFTGDRCQTCNGQVQWNYNNQPDCVPVDANGKPEKCNQDYQCGNPPYTVCYSTCQCRPNFTGPRCDVCPSPYRASFDEYGTPRCQ